MIGDVGFVSSAKGGFLPIFNIFHDKKGPKDLVTTLPDNFVPIEPPFEEWEVRSTPGFFPPGAAIVSEGITASRTSEEHLYVYFFLFIRNSSKEQEIYILLPGPRRRNPIAP